MIATSLTSLFGLQYPLVLAPMAGVAGGRLAAAVSNAGALGLVGGGYGNRDWLQRELALVRAETERPWGVGLITWAADDALLRYVLEFQPHAVMLSFGDPRRFAAAIKDAGCKLICQVQDIAGARLAQEAGADLIVAQGTEGGGHGAVRATLPLVPAVVDSVAPLPVIAAGGIADGRGLAAALMLGAQGALLGTRFFASTEALGSAAIKARLVEAGGEQTQRTRVFDIVRGYHWPAGFTGRALRNRFMARWDNDEAGLARALETEQQAFQAAVAADDHDTVMVWASEAVDLIHSTEPAATLVARICLQAEAQLRNGARLIDETPFALPGE
ncbi:MAG: nitronate monooxygenase [Burkholderiaceae bacterium]